MKRLLTRLRISSLPCLIMSMLLLAACHDPHTSEILTQADRLMESAPDSAYSLLRSIDSTRLRRADAPLYAVLDAQAHHKLDLTPPSDSLLDIAVEHYTTHGPDSLLMRALFYRAVLYNSMGRTEGAVEDAMGAYITAETLHNGYWQAKSAELVSDLFRASYNFNEEAIWRSTAARLYRNVSKIPNYMFCLTDLSGAYLNLRDTANCRLILDSIDRELTLYGEIEGFKEYHLYSKIFFNLHFGSTNLVDSIFASPEYTEIIDKNPALSLSRVERLINTGRYKEAASLQDSIILSLDASDRPLAFYNNLLIGRATNDYDKLNSAVDSLFNSQSQLLNLAMTHPVASTQRDYYMQVADELHNRHDNTRRLLICIILGCIAAAALAIYAHHATIRRKDRKLTAKIYALAEAESRIEKDEQEKEIIRTHLRSLENDNARLKIILEQSLRDKENDDKKMGELINTLRNNDKEIKTLSARIDKYMTRMPLIYQERWSTINMLCREFNDRKTEPSDRLWTKIKKELLRIQSLEFYREVEKQLDTDMDMILSRLKSQCGHKLTDDDIKLCTLAYAGFDNPAISIITGDSLDSLYSRRYRIKKRIKASNAPDEELFLSRL